MNLFEQANAIEVAAKASARKGSTMSSPDTLTIPYFKGIVRKGDAYTLKINKTSKDDKGKTVKSIVDLKVKPLTGAFIISYATCLAYFICKEAKQPLTVFVVQALLQQEGFSLEDYSQGKTKGSKRIALHLKAIAEQRGLKLSCNDTGIIEGITDKIACEVLTAI